MPGILRKYALVLCCMVALILWSCKKPVNNSAYCNMDIKTGWVGPATLALEMTDSVAPAQLDICLQIAMHNLGEHKYIPIVLDIASPSRQRYTDTLLLPLHIIKEKGIYNSNNGYTTLQIPYRKNVITREAGEWNFTFIPYHKALADSTSQEDYREIYKAITRIGISCKKEIEQ